MSSITIELEDYIFKKMEEVAILREQSIKILQNTIKIG